MNASLRELNVLTVADDSKAAILSSSSSACSAFHSHRCSSSSQRSTAPGSSRSDLQRPGWTLPAACCHRLLGQASSACFEYGAVEDAVRLLRHTLWIQPGHTAARRDLKSLSAYLQHRWSEPGQGTVDPLSAMAEAEALEPELAFDFIDDAEPMTPDASAPEASQDDDDASWDDREDRAA